MAKNKQKKIRVAKNPSLPEVLLANDGKDRIREISDEDVMAQSDVRKEEPVKDIKPLKHEEPAKDIEPVKHEEPTKDIKPVKHEEPFKSIEPAKESGIKKESRAKSRHIEFPDDHEKSRGLRIAALGATFVGTLLLAIIVGCALALWDIDKTPADLKAVLFEKDAADTGLTFEDVSVASADSDNASNGLTFIDANEPIETADAEDMGADAEDAEGVSAKETEDIEEGDEADDGKVKAGDIVDGNMVVSAELSGISSIVRAGQDEAMAVTTLEVANATNPDDVYPLPFTAVDDSYFEDALFVGDSRFYGFCMWSGIPGANYCATSFNIFNYETFKVVQTGNGKVPIFNALPYNAFSKIYIKVGLNEMGTSEAAFEAKYAELIGRLREMEPRAIIYIHAVLPVTAAKSASDRTHNNPNILARNASLQEFAREQKAYYIDASSVVSDENGCLKSEMTGDGIHMASRYMGVWKQYLMEHAVVVPE